jgi:hypothetical protein
MLLLKKHHPTNLTWGSKYVAPGIDEATNAAREKVRLTAAEWTTIRAAINGVANIPSDAPRNVLMGYQYALYRKSRHLEQVRQQLEELHLAASESSWCRAALSNASYANTVGHQRRGSYLDNMDYSERSSLARNLESSFISVDERGNIIPKTPEAALMAAQTYLLTT